MGKNPFAKFTAGQEKKAYVEALDYEITYRELTMLESDGFSKRLLKNYKGKDNANIDMNEATKIMYEKIALCLIDPKITVDELKQLEVSATKAIQEIGKLIDGREDEDEDEGN